MTNMEKINKVANLMGEKVIDEFGRTVVAGRTCTPAVVRPFDHDPKYPTWSHGERFAAWRRTKCRPRDYGVPDEFRDDLAQGTLELVGELSEIADLVLCAEIDGVKIDNPVFVAKMTDEVGDAIFCLSWACDAWGDDLFIRQVMTGDPPDVHRRDRNIAGLKRMCLLALTMAGELANKAKKEIYQGREQSRDTVGVRLEAILDCIVIIARIVGLTPKACMFRNVQKLDARWPVGHSMAGGGVRTGEGA